MTKAASSLQDIPLTRKQADALITDKVKAIFELPAVVEAVKTAIRDPQNPLGLSHAEQKIFQTLEGQLKKVGRLPGIGRVAKGASNALDHRIRDEAVTSHRSKTARNALLDQLDEPITVDTLEAAMETMGEHVVEFKVLGFDDPEKIRAFIPKGQDADAFVESLKHFSAQDLEAVGALKKGEAAQGNWQQRATAGRGSEQGKGR